MQDNTVNITILDDDEIVLKLFELAFEGFKHPPISMRLFSDVDESLKENNLRVCDLFISDVNMPQMAGDQVIKTLRQLSLHRHIPVALMTSLDRYELVRYYDVPADVTIFSKPVNFDDIKKLIMAVYATKGLMFDV